MAYLPRIGRARGDDFFDEPDPAERSMPRAGKPVPKANDMWSIFGKYEEPAPGPGGRRIASQPEPTGYERPPLDDRRGPRRPRSGDEKRGRDGPSPPKGGAGGAVRDRDAEYEFRSQHQQGLVEARIRSQEERIAKETDARARLELFSRIEQERVQALVAELQARVSTLDKFVRQDDDGVKEVRDRVMALDSELGQLQDGFRRQAREDADAIARLQRDLRAREDRERAQREAEAERGAAVDEELRSLRRTVERERLAAGEAAAQAEGRAQALQYALQALEQGQARLGEQLEGTLVGERGVRAELERRLRAAEEDLSRLRDRLFSADDEGVRARASEVREAVQAAREAAAARDAELASRMDARVAHLTAMLAAEGDERRRGLAEAAAADEARDRARAGEVSFKRSILRTRTIGVKKQSEPGQTVFIAEAKKDKPEERGAESSRFFSPKLKERGAESSRLFSPKERGAERFFSPNSKAQSYGISEFVGGKSDHEELEVDVTEAIGVLRTNIDIHAVSTDIRAMSTDIRAMSTDIRAMSTDIKLFKYGVVAALVMLVTLVLQNWGILPHAS